MMVPISVRFLSVILKLRGQKGLLDTILDPSLRSANLSAPPESTTPLRNLKDKEKNQLFYTAFCYLSD